MVKRVTVANRLEWIETRADNYEELKRFYGSVLGLALNFEEERKDFVQFKVGSSKTYLALLDTKNRHGQGWRVRSNPRGPGLGGVH